MSNLTNMIPTRFADDDMAALRAAAADDERKVSDFIRITVRRALREGGYLSDGQPSLDGVTAEEAFALGQAAARMGVEPR